MTLNQIIKIELITNNMTITILAKKLGISRQLLYHHLNRKNPEIILKIEKILFIKEGSLLK
ncbi:MAG: helix-turn-helix domain-containing protein [Fusobacteriaceae bacterium]